MRKEADQFTDSTFLEGMTSIRALIHAKDAGVNDRPIEVIYYDSADKTRERDLTYLRAKSMEYGYRLEPKTRKEIDDMAIGNTHGGLIAKCGARSLPRLTDSVAALHQNGFFSLTCAEIRTASMRSLTALRIPIILVMPYVLYTRVAQTASFLMSEIG